MFSFCKSAGVRGTAATPPNQKNTAASSSLGAFTGGSSRYRKSQPNPFTRPTNQHQRRHHHHSNNNNSNSNNNNKRRERDPDSKSVRQRYPPIKKRDERQWQHAQPSVRHGSAKGSSGAGSLASLGQQQYKTLLSSSFSSSSSFPTTATPKTNPTPTLSSLVPSSSSSSSSSSFDDALASLCTSVNDITLGIESNSAQQRKNHRAKQNRLFAAQQITVTKENRLQSNNRAHQTTLNNAHVRQSAAEHEFKRLQRLVEEERQQDEMAVSEHRRKIDLLKKEQEEMKQQRMAEEEREREKQRAEEEKEEEEEEEEEEEDPEHGTVEERLAHRLKPLTIDEEASVQNAITMGGGRGHSSEILIKKFKVEMTRKLMSCLSGLTWLNDEAVNFNMEMLNERDRKEHKKRLALYTIKEERKKLKAQAAVESSSVASSSSSSSSSTSSASSSSSTAASSAAPATEPPTRRVWCCKSFLMTKLASDGYKAVQRWSKKAKLNSKHDIFDLWRMVVPVNISNSHWTSVHVDFVNKELLYYDSMGGGGTEWLQLVYSYLEGEWNKYHSADGPFDGDDSWSMRSLGRSIPQQRNCSDCGMFTCTFATYETDVMIIGGTEESKLIGLPLHFSQSNMPYMRKRLALDILNGRLD